MSRLNLHCNGHEELYKPLLSKSIHNLLVFSLVVYLVAYTLFLFLNLHLMPLAWVDEIAGLEPAVNFIQGNGYSSKLWPYDGADELFLAYLPLQGSLHILFIKILGFSIYTVRLPYALFLLGTGFIFFKNLRLKKIHLLYALILSTLLLNEKALFETARGIRIEPLATLLIGISFYGIFSRRYFFTSISIALMLLLHPYVWPLCLVLFIYLGRKHSDVNHPSLLWIRPNIHWIPIILVGLLYLLFIQFNFELLISQFSAQAERHSATRSIGGQLYDHFIERFWPYYKTQPHIPLIIYVAFFRSVYQLAHRQAKIADFTLLFTHLCWLIFLSPVHRYDSILTVLSLYSLIPFIQALHTPKMKLAPLLISLGFLTVSFIDPVSRQALAYIQKEQRNPKEFLTWLEAKIPVGSSIISGHEITYYLSAEKRDLDFFLFNTTPYRFDFKAYDNLLLIADKPLEKALVLGEFSVNDSTQPMWTKKVKTKTYNGLYLLRFENINTYEHSLAHLKSKNSEEVNDRRYD